MTDRPLGLRVTPLTCDSPERPLVERSAAGRLLDVRRLLDEGDRWLVVAALDADRCVGVLGALLFATVSGRKALIVGDWVHVPGESRAVGEALLNRTAEICRAAGRRTDAVELPAWLAGRTPCFQRRETNYYVWSPARRG